MAKSDNQRIAQNTIFLYFRMMLTMFVSLYTSRVTLQVLGVDDYGIYQTVGGVVTFLSFISNALGSGTSRFITYELGKKEPRLDVLFSTVRIAHIILGIAIVLLGEIIGVWFIQNKLVIPDIRLSAAIFAFHFSVISTFFNITQIPYNAIIIAYEKMNVYAYLSIVEVILKLAIVYPLKVIPFDKLKVYSALFCLVTVLIMCAYRIYCIHNYTELRSKLVFDKDMFKEVASFSGWNLITTLAGSFANQGVTVVTNMFFAPAVVTVRSLALNISSAINQFIGNFRTAVNPQIVKKYAAKDYEGSKKLALLSTKFTYYLMLVIVVPLYILTEPVLKIWLGEIPDGLITFVRLALIQGLFQAFDTSLYVPIYAKGQIKENAIISPLFNILQLPIVYILFRLGFPAISSAYIQLMAYVILGIIVKPILVHIIVDYNLKEVIMMIVQCLLITLLSLIVPIIISRMLDVSKLVGFAVVLIVSCISVVCIVFLLGMDKKTRNTLVDLLKSKICQNEDC